MKYVLSLAAWISGFLTILLVLPILIPSVSVLGVRGISIVGSFMMRVIMWGFLVRVRCEGREKIDLSRAYLYMANHASFLDFFVLAGYLPGDVRGIEAAEHFSWPIWGIFLRKAGLIPIDRSNPRASLASISLAAQRLQEGISILVLPEGTRTLDGRMLPFKKLPFKLVKKGGVDLVPVGLVGTYRIKRKNSWLLRPGRVIMRFGEPISAEVVASTDLEALREMTRKRIAELVGDS